MSATGTVSNRSLERSTLVAADPPQRRRLLRAYLRDLHARVARREPVTHDDEPLFLESIAAIELQVSVEAELGVPLRLFDLAEAPSLNDLVQAVELVLASEPDGAGGLPVVVADGAGRFEPFGLTDVQHAYWLGRSGLFELGDVSTHLFLEFESVEFDVDRAELVLDRLVRRHDMLRAVVRSDGRQQVLERVPGVRVGFEDLSGLGPSQVRQRIAAARQELSHQVRPADRWPLFELRAQRLPGGLTRVYLSLDLLIADATSIQVLLSEWSSWYEDLDRQLPPLELTFRDYLAAVQQLPETPGYQQARRYWLSRLEDLPPAPELPLAASPGSVSSRFTRRRFSLEPAGWARLKQQAQAWGVTPSAVLCTAYAQVLACWSASPRFTLNLTAGDRLPVHPDVERVIGDFTSLLLLEVDTTTPAGFGHHARAVQEQLWRDLEHRAFGGVQVLRELARAHGPARAAMPVVFTSALAGPMPGRPDGTLPGLGRLVDGISQTPQVHLDHQVYEHAGALMLSWDAVEALFPPDLLDEAFAAYQQLLHRLASDPAAWDQPDPLVTLPASHARTQQQANHTAGPIPQGLLHQAVAATAAHQPDQLAVISATGSLTYHQLVSTARRIGHRLRQLGAQPGTLVAVSMDKGWEQVAAVLGILESGAAYLPLDPSLPTERRTHLLERTHTQLVLTQTHLATTLDWPPAVTTLPVDHHPTWANHPDHPLPATQHPTDLAYVIFTSGSTGQPKGVMIDHRGALNTILDINHRFHITPTHRVLAISSLSFDLSVWDIFGTLTAGATIVMPDPGTERNPAHWAHLIAHHQITTWNSVPALFELLCEHATHHDPTTLTTLQLAMLSGDWIPTTLPDRATTHAPHLRLISLGGATEASIWSIYHPIDHVDPTQPSIPYGRPLTNQTFHVLDHHLQPRPTWVPGHLYIGGTGLAHGYWQDPHQTTTTFITHPHTGQRLYHTGDLGRYHPDGTIEFLGRQDFQVKIGGHRIELGEIETTLTTHPDIATALVTAHGQPPAPRHLVAYLIPHPHTQPNPDHIRTWLHHKLPHYMIPTTILTIDALPLTPNGKIDRTNLPEPTNTPTRDHTPPRTPTEHTLTTIWTNLLPTTTIGIHDNLFDLGADSLLALRATAAADTNGLHLTLQHIFDNPTIAQQATTAGVHTLRVRQGRVAGPTELTPSQRWFLGQDLPQRHHWNDASFLLSLQQPLDLAALTRALAQVIDHHDALRLRFADDAAGWRAWISDTSPAEPLPFSVHDLSHLDSRQQRETVTEISDGLQSSLDLREGPVLRVAYFDLGERPHCLLFLAHWLAVDHYSARTVIEDLLTGYEQASRGQQTTLPPKTTSLPEWAQRLAERAQTEELLATLDYWTRPEREKADRLAVDQPAGDNDLASLANVTVRIDAAVTEALLRAVPQALGCDMEDVLCAAVARSVPYAGVRNGQRRLLLDIERHGRDLALPGASVSRTVGRLSVLAPVLVESDPAQSVETTVREVARQLRQVPGAESYGLLRHLCRDPRAATLATMPPAPVGLNYVGQLDEVFVRSDLLSVPRMSYGRQRSRVGRRFRELDILCYVAAGRLAVTAGYSANRYDRSTIERLTAALAEELTSLARAADRHLDHHPRELPSA